MPRRINYVFSVPSLERLARGDPMRRARCSCTQCIIAVNFRICAQNLAGDHPVYVHARACTLTWRKLRKWQWRYRFLLRGSRMISRRGCMHRRLLKLYIVQVFIVRYWTFVANRAARTVDCWSRPSRKFHEPQGRPLDDGGRTAAGP